MTLRSRGLARVLVLLLGIAGALALFWAAQRYFWAGSIRGSRAVIAVSRQILGRDPTPEELVKGVEIWRQSPEALLRAVTQYEAGLRQETAYGLSLVDQDGRILSKRVGPLALVLDPFTVYTTWPNQRAKKFTIDEHGFRATPRRPGKPRIVVFGGSAAFGQGLPGDEHTLAWLLAQRFGDFDVINASVVGYLSGQELALMIHRLDRLRPAAYVVMNGWNDLFDQDFGPRRRQAHLFGFNNQFFEIQDRLHAYHGIADGPADLASRAGGPPKAPANEEIYLRELRDAYVTNVERMHAFAAARGARFLVVFQPELGNKRSPSDEERKKLEAWNTWFRYLDLGFPAKYAELVRRAKEHSRAAGIPFADPQQEPEISDERETLFYDPPHPNERGQVLLADVLERRLRRLLAEPRPD